MIPARRADSSRRMRTKRILGQYREFVVRTYFPKPIGGGFGVVAELRLALPQCFLGPFALRQVERESDTLISAFLEGRRADQHGNTAAVFPEVLLLKRLQAPGRLQVGQPPSFIPVTPFRLPHVPPLHPTRHELLPPLLPHAH